MLKDASIEKIKLEKIIDCKPVWEKKYFFVFWTCCSDQIDQTAILCFLTFQRMSSAILDDWTPDESAAAKSSQGIKPRKLSFIAQCIVSDDHLYGLFCEMHLGWMALFGHSICWKGSFGRGSAACYAWPTCPAAERVPKKKKAPTQQKCQHPAVQSCQRAPGRQQGGRQAGRRITCRVSRSSWDSSWRKRQPLGSSIFQLLWWLQLMQSHGWWSDTAVLLWFFLQLPPLLSAGWAGCCVCPAPGRARAAWKHPAAQAVGVERAARQAAFYSCQIAGNRIDPI